MDDLFSYLFITSSQCYHSQMSQEEAAREAAEEAERAKEAERQKELIAAQAAAKTKAKPAAKGKKSRSPSPKKGGKKEEGAVTPARKGYVFYKRFSTLLKILVFRFWDMDCRLGQSVGFRLKTSV